jgi:catechol 2,3-dioxygenase-like lactoylglutathione lyase family enzyme
MLRAAKDSLDVGVVVGDIARSLAFYRDLLGLELIGEMPVWFGTLYRLRFGSSDLKLIQPKVVPPHGAAGIETQLGIRYITFVIQGITELCRALQEKGVEFHLAEREVRPGVRIAMVKDPDGNIVEFVERG